MEEKWLILVIGGLKSLIIPNHLILYQMIGLSDFLTILGRFLGLK